MTAPDPAPRGPLPSFTRSAADGVDHPVLAAVLAELDDRDASDEPVLAYYSDGP